MKRDYPYCVRTPLFVHAAMLNVLTRYGSLILEGRFSYDRGSDTLVLAMAHPAQPRIMIVLGQGGHTTELLYLVDLLGPANDYCYLLFEEDVHSAAHIRHPGPLYRVPRPRYRPGHRLHPLWDPLLALRSLVAIFRVIQRVRPHALLMTGPSIAILAALIGKIFGARVIFIETGSRVTCLSNTGKVMRFLAHDFFVQSGTLARQTPGARFAGRLW